MKAAKLREHTPAELRQVHTDTTRAILDYKAKKGIGDSSEQPLRIRTLRRELARVKTIMKEQGVAEDV
jgi:ribosomal protein L29